MAYYMMCEKKRGNYEIVDITKSNCFKKLSKFTNGGCDLNEIDLFTSQFYDIDELKKHLYELGLISYDDLNRELTARRKNKGKYDKVRLDFLYQKDIEYLIDPKKIIDRVWEKLENGEYRFIQKFVNNYVRHRECSSTLPDVRYYCNESIRKKELDDGFNILDENGDDLITRTIKLLIYKYDQKADGTITYTDEIVHRNLHSLICFIDHYDEMNDDTSEKDKGKEGKRKVRIGEQLSFL